MSLRLYYYTISLPAFFFFPFLSLSFPLVPPLLLFFVIYLSLSVSFSQFDCLSSSLGRSSPVAICPLKLARRENGKFDCIQLVRHPTLSRLPLRFSLSLSIFFPLDFFPKNIL